MTLNAIDFKAWKCPVCKRVTQIRSDAVWVQCGGGWVGDKPLHEPAYCYEVPDSEADPIDLAKSMGLLPRGI